jgi:hypothetical protein
VLAALVAAAGGYREVAGREHCSHTAGKLRVANPHPPALTGRRLPPHHNVAACPDEEVSGSGGLQHGRGPLHRPSLDEPGWVKAASRMNVKGASAAALDLRAEPQHLAHLRPAFRLGDLATEKPADLAVAPEGAEGVVDLAEPGERRLNRSRVDAGVVNVHRDHRSHRGFGAHGS